MKKLILASLLSVGVACACDTFECERFVESMHDFVELHNLKEINADVFKEKIDAATEAYNISKRICETFLNLNVNEIVSLQTKNPHFANLNDDWNKNSNYLKSFLKARIRLIIFVFLENNERFLSLIYR
ncbi:hypothetical protein [Helicobacter trogontum]|uniref:Lipoprotein n=2 Tax=Helicobacter TaxID=209 RepID=A0A4U8TBY4_9HELI|nr:hypothetical protein [Helicobacter trogontum]MCI5787007.1 hypothetical protein [Helicobacter trogontum]MDY5184416.1 hypothetical protein [Helicobacter trogontum]TLD96137.1 hypothetical protein LS80_008860 [Helicobacter trogontum]